MDCTMKKPFERLPKTVTPINYEISLTPDLKKLTFEGHESVLVQVHQPTDKIVMNSNKLIISVEKSNVLNGDQKSIPIKDIVYNQEEETITLCLPESLQPGQVTLNLSFDATLCENLRGFYPSTYVGPDGQKRTSAVTQFEATDARRAFPCWDEPAHKATFDITLVVPDDGKTVALSNMPIKQETRDDQKRRVVHFERTPIMSTYLVAFVVGEYEYIESRTKHGVLVRVYTPIGKTEQGRFALQVAIGSLDFLTDYFQIPYPLIKLDLIAIADFAAGAMENWGLVTYRETCLLVDPSITSTLRKQNIAMTVAHELAHQWFGNLVTMEWWTHLWLNESFATFMQYLCVDHLFPEFSVWNQFVTDVFSDAMSLDSLDNSHPIEVPVGHPSEVEEIFDEISYSKGASLIRMLYNYIGGENFQKGMSLYLKRHSYKNALTEDLWDALEEASQKPIRKMMSTWTRQKGYPVVMTKLVEQKQLELNQQKFNLNGNLSEEDSKMLWAVPIQVITDHSGDTNKPLLETLFEKRDEQLSLPISDFKWLKLNPSSLGTYRVNYGEELLKRLLSVASGSLKSLDRLNILDDLSALTTSGKNNSCNLLRAVEVFKMETDYNVWSVMGGILSKYHCLLYGSGCYEPFRKYATEILLHKAYPMIGWDAKPEEPYETTLLRPLLIGHLVSLEYSEVTKQCLQAFEDHVQKRKQIPADLRAPVYHSVALGCQDEETWEKFMKLYREADSTEEKNRIARSLGKVKKPEFIDRMLKFAISDEVRSQDTVFVIASIAHNPYGRQATWEFFKTHLETIFKPRYASGFLGNCLVKSVTEPFHSEKMAKEVEEYFQKNMVLGWERAIQQSIETIRLNAKLLERDQQNIEQFFNAKF